MAGTILFGLALFAIEAILNQIIPQLHTEFIETVWCSSPSSGP